MIYLSTIICQGTMSYPLCDSVEAVDLAGPAGECLRSNELDGAARRWWSSIATWMVLRPAYLAGGESCNATWVLLPAGGAAMQCMWCVDMLMSSVVEASMQWVAFAAEGDGLLISPAVACYKERLHLPGAASGRPIARDGGRRRHDQFSLGCARGQLSNRMVVQSPSNGLRGGLNLPPDQPDDA